MEDAVQPQQPVTAERSVEEREASALSKRLSLQELKDKSPSQSTTSATEKDTSNNSNKKDTVKKEKGAKEEDPIARLLSSIRACLQSFKLMPRKTHTILELCTEVENHINLKKDKTKGEKLKRSTNQNKSEIEQVLHWLLESLRRVEEHKKNVYGYLVSFLALDAERAKLNESIYKLAVLQSDGKRHQWFSGGMEARIIDEDKSDILEESKVFRVHLEYLTAQKETETGKTSAELLKALKTSDADGLPREEEPSRKNDALGIFDISRKNIFLVCSLVKRLVLSANAELDKLVSLQGETMFEAKDDVITYPIIRIDGKEFHLGTFGKSPALFYRPYSKENRNETASVMLSSLPFQNRVSIRQELDQWSKLEHPNILRLFGASFLNDRLTFVLEPFDMTLYEFLYQEDFQIDKKQAETIIRGICRGLSFLHRNVLLHRCLSPQNIVLSHDLGVKLSGFGLSWADQSTASVPFSKNYVYAAPEVIKGSKRYSFATDMFSFAMLAWEVAHRQKPFAGKGYEQVVKLVCDNNARPGVEAHSSITDKWFQELLHNCWAKDPSKRLSANAALQEIQNNTKNTWRASQKVMQGMLSFIPKRNNINPATLIAELFDGKTPESRIVQLLETLLQNAKKESAAGKKTASKTSNSGEWFFLKLWDAKGHRAIMFVMRRHESNARIQELGCALFRIIGRSAFEPNFSQRQFDLVKDGAGIVIINAMKHNIENERVSSAACGALKSLTSAGEHGASTEDRRDKLMHQKVFAALLNTMEAFPDHFEIQKQCCGTLRNLTFLITAIRHEKAPHAIRGVLRSCLAFQPMDQSLTRLACGAIRNFSFDTLNQRVLMDNGGVDLILQALDSFPSDAAIQSSCFLALWNLCFVDDSLATCLIDQGIDQVLKRAVKTHREESDLVANACSLVDNLAWMENNRVKLQEQDASSLVQGLLKGHPESEEVWESGVAALKSLSWGDREPLADTETLEWLFERIIGHFLHNSEIVRNGVLLLQNLTCEEENLTALFSLGATNWVMKAMTTHVKEHVIQEAGCGVLCNLATPERNKEPILKAGATVWIQKAMHNHPTNRTIQKNGCCALTRLARSDVNLDVMSGEGYSYIAGLIKSATVRFPEFLQLPDLIDVEDMFPISTAELENCSICLEPLCYEDIDLPFHCEHSFHVRCASKWSKVQSTCPLCRSPLSPDFVPSDDISEIDPRQEEDEYLLRPFLEEAQGDEEDAERVYEGDESSSTSSASQLSQGLPQQEQDSSEEQSDNQSQRLSERRSTTTPRGSIASVLSSGRNSITMLLGGALALFQGSNPEDQVTTEEPHDQTNAADSRTN